MPTSLRLDGWRRSTQVCVVREYNIGPCGIGQADLILAQHCCNLDAVLMVKKEACRDGKEMQRRRHESAEDGSPSGCRVNVEWLRIPDTGELDDLLSGQPPGTYEAPIANVDVLEILRDEALPLTNLASIPRLPRRECAASRPAHRNPGLNQRNICFPELIGSVGQRLVAQTFEGASSTLDVEATLHRCACGPGLDPTHGWLLRSRQDLRKSCQCFALVLILATVVLSLDNDHTVPIDACIAQSEETLLDDRRQA